MSNYHVLQAELARLDFLVRNEQKKKQQESTLLKEIQDLEKALATKTSRAPKQPPVRSSAAPSAPSAPTSKQPPLPRPPAKKQSSQAGQAIPDVKVLRQIKDLEKQIAQRKAKTGTKPPGAPGPQGRPPAAKSVPRQTRWVNPALQAGRPSPAKRKLTAAALLVSPLQRRRQSRHKQYVRAGASAVEGSEASLGLATTPVPVPATAPGAATPAGGGKSRGTRAVVVAGETYLSNRRQLVRLQAKDSPVQRPGLSRNKTLAKAPGRNKKEYCVFYNKLGKCNRGEACRYEHDPRRVTICLRYLRGECTGPCLLRHQVERDQMPHCMHFLQGICTRPDCPYLHVGISRDAELCPQFLQGRCPRGRHCTLLHSFLCPEWRKTGSCSSPSCRLIHRRPQEKKRPSVAVSPPAKRLRVDKQIRPRFHFDEPAAKAKTEEENTEVAGATVLAGAVVVAGAGAGAETPAEVKEDLGTVTALAATDLVPTKSDLEAS